MKNKPRHHVYGMEIELNPNQVSAARAGNVGKARAAATDFGDSVASNGITDLQQKLQAMPLVRPEKMAAAQQLLSNVQYPPGRLLNGIAHLLAIRLKESPSQE